MQGHFPLKINLHLFCDKCSNLKNYLKVKEKSLYFQICKIGVTSKLLQKEKAF